MTISFCCLGQPNSYNYYYKGQAKPITLSEKVMIAKFEAGTTIAAKQQVISSANVELLNGTMSEIPDIVQLKSKVLQRQVWVFPCGITPIYDKKLSKKEKEIAIISKLVPCPGCPPPPPPNCTPYQIWQDYDNF
jgi:hypothetical protein